MPVLLSLSSCQLWSQENRYIYAVRTYCLDALDESAVPFTGCVFSVPLTGAGSARTSVGCDAERWLPVSPCKRRKLYTSSMMTWALLPPNPNELIEARLSPPDGQTAGWTGNFRPHSSTGIFGFGFSNQIFGGTMPFSRTRIAFSNPATPAAPSRCPILLFTAPTYIGSSGLRTFEKASAIAPASIGSPTGVPVPWASK